MPGSIISVHKLVQALSVETEDTFLLAEKVKADPFTPLAATTTAVPTVPEAPGKAEAKENYEGSHEAVRFAL